MSESGVIYQELILDHNKKPRNFHALDSPEAHKAEGFNPLCGDQIAVWVVVDGDTIRDISFQGQGCAISKASASMMTERLKGHPVAEAEALFAKFHNLVKGIAVDADAPPELGKLEAFAGVAEFPLRVKCASLAWHALKAALLGQAEAVSTE